MVVEAPAPVRVRGQRRIAVTFPRFAAMLNALAHGERWESDGLWPDDLEVQRVHVDFESDSFEAFVTSEGFEKVEPGMVIPYWTPRFKEVNK